MALSDTVVPGTVIVNRVTGERATVGVTSAMTGGEYLRAEMEAVPGGHVVGERSEPARALVEVRPARNFEAMITVLWGLANDGRTNAKGMPGPLQLAVIADAYAGDIVFTKPPPWVQRVMVAILAPIGRALGRRAYDPRWEELIVESVPETAAADPA